MSAAAAVVIPFPRRPLPSLVGRPDQPGEGALVETVRQLAEAVQQLQAALASSGRTELRRWRRVHRSPCDSPTGRSRVPCPVSRGSFHQGRARGAMLEPLSLSVADLARRWGQTEKQILGHAMGPPGLALCFPFEGLLFDVGDEWLRQGGAWLEEREQKALAASIEQSESLLRRRAHGNLDRYRSISSDAAVELRQQIDRQREEHKRLTDLLSKREVERNRRTFRGFVRTTPHALFEIFKDGRTIHPHMAFRADVPITLAVNRDGRGHDGEVYWKGAMVALEPLPGHATYGKEYLTADDLLASMQEVKAIEASRAVEPAGAAEPQGEPELATVSTRPSVDQSAKALVSPIAAGDKPKKTRPSGEGTQRRQERALLQCARDLGIDLKALPKFSQGGECPEKQRIKKALLEGEFAELFKRLSAFKNTWERLSVAKKIGYSDSPGDSTS